MVIVKRKTLSFWERMYLPEVLRGLSITFRKMFEPKITRQYPEEALPVTEVTRGQPRLVVNALRCSRTTWRACRWASRRRRPPKTLL